jgi:hypothetical protein
MKYQLLILVLLGLSLGSSGPWAKATDISGTWAVAYMGTSGDPITLTFVFKQQGEKLTGTFAGVGPIGEQKIIGTVKGDKAVFGFELKGLSNKGSVTATFNGTIESPTKMTGTVGSPFCGDGCKWTATKKR